MRLPSGENTIASSVPAVMRCEESVRPRAGSQSRNVPSSPPDASRAPEGDNATEFTPPRSPRNVRTRFPSERPHIAMVPSMLADAAVDQSAVTDMALMKAPCAGMVRTGSPLATLHDRSEPSKPPEIKCAPSGEKAMVLIVPLCPVKLRSNRPVSASQSFKGPSHRPYVAVRVRALPLPAGINWGRPCGGRRRSVQPSMHRLQPRPSKGILVALMFMNRMFVSSGRLAM
jgi:hypothetical protein